MRVICEYQAYIEPHLMNIVSGIFEKTANLRGDEITSDLHAVASEARTIEARLSKSDWVVGRQLLRRRHGDFPLEFSCYDVRSSGRRRVSCHRVSCLSR